MADNYHTFDGKGHSFTFKINKLDNGTFMASVVHERQRPRNDDLGALYYVVAVLLIYGCSILLMLGSYVRKNKMDQKMNRYHKEMINVRKRERQIQLCNAARKAAAANAKLEVEALSGIRESLDDKKMSSGGGGDGGDGGGSGGGGGGGGGSSGGGDSTDGGTRNNAEEDDEYGEKSDREKMYLDLPLGGYANTDSDNDTSTEGEACYFQAVVGKPAKSILKSKSKSVTLVVPSLGDALNKQVWSCDSDSSCYWAEQQLPPSPNIAQQQQQRQQRAVVNKNYDVSFV